MSDVTIQKRLDKLEDEVKLLKSVMRKSAVAHSRFFMDLEGRNHFVGNKARSADIVYAEKCRGSFACGNRKRIGKWPRYTN